MSSNDILNAAALLAQAERVSGLNDYGDDTLPERFTLAVDAIKKKSLNEASQRIAAEVCVEILVSRLQVFEDRKRYPIDQERIEKPIFATGQARSGTTLLHALLSADPNARAPRYWEVAYPSPPPGLAGADDPRRARADDDWREIIRKVPRWLTSHPYNDMLGNGLPECERIWAMDFRQITPDCWWRVPMDMVVGELPADPRAQYRMHKILLQQFQYARPKKHWALKGFHAQRLDALFEAYPDARIIWTHRDPAQAIASSIVMMRDLIEGFAGHPYSQEDAGKLRDWLCFDLESLVKNPLIDDPRIHHIRYPDFVADPVGTIREFYGKYDIPFGPGTERAMRDYLKNNKSDRYGKFKYSTDDLGVDDIEALHARLAPYRSRFGLEIEQRK
jgi:hypothetical protein